MRHWLATLLLCTACVPRLPLSTAPAETWTWAHPSATPEQTRHDIYECERDSIAATPWPPEPVLVPTVQVEIQTKERSDLFRQCMDNRGYRWEEK